MGPVSGHTPEGNDSAGRPVCAQGPSSRLRRLALLVVLLTSTLPFVLTVVLALTNWSGRQGQVPSFVGLENFRLALGGATGEDLAGVLAWTILFAAVGTGVVYALGLPLALILHHVSMWERDLYIKLLMLPWALPVPIAVLAWQGVLNRDFGLVNGILTRDLGLSAVPWLMDPSWARVSVLLVSVWLGLPVAVWLCYIALGSVGPNMLDAARVDGAGRLRLLTSIRLPRLCFAVLPAIVTTFTTNLTGFGVVYLLTQGDPPIFRARFAGSTDLLLSYIYKLAVHFRLMGLASACAALSLLLLALLGAVNLKVAKAHRESGG